MTNRNFDEWLSKFRPSISSYDYYIDFEKVLAWVGKTAGTAATGAVIGSLLGPLGTFVGAGIGAAVGGIVSTATANDGKSYARKEVSEAIAKAKGMTKNDIDRSLIPVYNDINNQNQMLKKAIKSELDNIDDADIDDVSAEFNAAFDEGDNKSDHKKKGLFGFKSKKHMALSLILKMRKNI